MAVRLLCGLAHCQHSVEDGTVLACAGPDVTDDLARSVLSATRSPKRVSTCHMTCSRICRPTQNAAPEQAPEPSDALGR
jgi:hypothetical protein